MIRKSALVIIAIIVIIVGLAFFGMVDRFVESMTEVTLEKVLGADVEIDDLDFEFKNATASFESLKVGSSAGTAKSIAQTGPVRLDLLGSQLLAKKLVITEMSLKGLAIDTSASLPGRAEKKPSTESDPTSSESGQRSLLANLPELNLDTLSEELDIKAYTQPENLASLKEIRRIEEEGSEKIAYWHDAAEINGISDELDALRLDAKLLKARKISSMNDVTVLTVDVDQFNKRVSQVEKTIETTRTSITRDLNQLTSGFSSLQELTEKDIKGAEKLANITRINPSQIGMAMFGRETINQINNVLGYLDLVKKIFFKKKSKKPERRQGQFISYPVTGIVYPRFLVGRTQVSGQLLQDGSPSVQWAGMVKDLSLDHEILGGPTTYLFEGHQLSGPTQYRVEGTIDGRIDKGYLSLNLSSEGNRLDQIKLGNNGRTLPKHLNSDDATISVDLRLTEESLSGSLVLLAKTVQFVFDDHTDSLSEVDLAVRDVFYDLKAVELRSTISGKLTQPRLTISTNFDNLLNDRLNRVAGEKIDTARAEIRSQIESQVTKRKAEAEKKLQGEKERVLSQLDGPQMEIDRHNEEIARRRQELEDRQLAATNQIRREAIARREAADDQLKRESDTVKRDLENQKKELEKNLDKTLEGLFK